MLDFERQGSNWRVATRPQERPGIPRKVIPAAFFYVQDERYAAGAGMRTTAGMQEVEQRRSSCRGAARVSFARQFT